MALVWYRIFTTAFDYGKHGTIDERASSTLMITNEV
jgi:hypothetical protein